MSKTKTEDKRGATLPEVRGVSPRRKFLLGTLAAVPAAALLGACSVDALKPKDEDEKDEEGEKDDASEEGDTDTRDTESSSEDTPSRPGRPSLDAGADSEPSSPSIDASRPSTPSTPRADASSPSTPASDASTPSTPRPDAGTPTTGDAGAPTSCTVYPQQTQGPYYLDLDLVRNDIREGKEGKLLKLSILVLGANGCTPRPNTPVDIWHCDAQGVYSGYRSQLGGLDTTGQKFLRGTLLTDKDGRVEFTTIFPGWYPGRTPHIHFKVHASQRTSAISQIYFPDEVAKAVYATAPYSKHTGNFTPLASDSVNRAGRVAPVTPKAEGDGFRIDMSITVAG